MTQKEASVLLILALAGSLTAVPVPLGVTYIPYAVLFTLSGYLFAFHWRLLTLRDLIFLVGVYVVLSANILFSGIEGFEHQLKALLQLMAGFGFAVFVPNILAATGRDRFRTILASTVAIVLVLAALERSGLIREISDSWRHWIFGMVAYTDPYASDARDLAMVGFIRPKVFGPEPAHLAGFLFVCMVVTSFVMRTARGMLALFACNVIAWLLIGSPVLLLSLIALCIVSVYRFGSFLIYLLPLVLFACAALLLVQPSKLGTVTEGVQARFEGLFSGDERGIRDDSVRSRLYVPFAVSIPNSIAHNPLWGVGIGGKEKLSRMIDPNYSRYSESIGSTEQTLGTNSLGSMISTLGILGFFFTIGLVLWYWAPIGFNSLAIASLSVGLFFFTRGAYETQSFWFAIFLILGAAGLLKGHAHLITSSDYDKNQSEQL